MKVIFFGTPELAATALTALIESRHEVLAVVTQPDKASGRGRTMKYLPVKQTAVDAGIPVLQPASVKDESVLEELRALGADIYAVAAYSQKLPQALLDIPPHGCINIHPSLLPKYRGASPLRGPILYGDDCTGVTIMHMSAQLDAGDIITQETIPMDPKETVRSLSPKVAALGARLLVETIDAIEAGKATSHPQVYTETSYIKQLDKEDGRIRFSDPAVTIERQIRACDPWPSAFTTLNGKMFKIWDADVIPEEEDTEGRFAGTGDMPAGSVIYSDKKQLIVRTGKDVLLLREVQLEGKKRMTIEEFLRGRKIDKGYQFES